MVRLKDYVEYFNLLTNKFQFQYGAIKRQLRQYGSKDSTLFQFQYGAIKSFVCAISPASVLVFQFQYGAIKSGVNIFRHTVGAWISIPVWCD